MSRYLSLLIPLIIIGTPVHAQQAPTPVIVSPVVKKQMVDEVEALGTLKANESVELTSTVTELVTDVMFEDGQEVKKGETLVKMDIAEEWAELTEEKAVAAEASRQVKRLEPLVARGATSEASIDEARSSLAAANARTDAIQSRINQRYIKAPFDGVVGLRNISVGALAQPGSMITTIDDISVMKLDFSVPEIFLATVKPGTKITATSPAFPDQSFEGTITGVDSRIDPVTRSFEARAKVENSDGSLKPGLLMYIVLQKDPRDTLIIPEEAIIAEGSKNFVMQVIDNTIARTEVEIGARQYGEVEILDGLEEGGQVVTHGTLTVRDGSEVSITAVKKDNEPLTELLNQNSDNAASTEDTPE